jgi:hypothetical protein
VIDLPPLGDPDAFTRTRCAWHAVAEHVLASARHRATGRIGLRVTPGGCGTPPYERDGTTEELRIAGRDLVVRIGEATTVTALTTIAAAAAVAGIEPGGPSDVYRLTTPLEPDAPLVIDDDAARALAAWFELASTALAELRAEISPALDPSDIQLWPEHFDVAFDFGEESLGTRGTFGASPGDAEHPEPYLYVTHWAEVADDPFWNDDVFAGASLPYSEVRAGGDARRTMLTFYRNGSEALSRSRS